MQLMLGGWHDGLRLVNVSGDEAPTGEVENTDMIRVPYPAVIAACNGEHYPMSLSPTDAAWVIAAVNQGIDSFLEACNVPERGDSYEWKTTFVGTVALARNLVCKVSPTSLPTLLRRLGELDPDELGCTDSTGEPIILVGDILQSLGFDEHGEFVGRDED